MSEREGDHEHDRSGEHELTRRGSEGQPPGPPVTPRQSPYDRLPERAEPEEDASGED
jgi:hypothetical protein